MNPIDKRAFDFIAPPEKPNAASNNKDAIPLKEQEKERYEQDTKWRDRLALWVVVVDSAWLFMILIILIHNNNYLGLSDSVLMVLLGTTTLNVLGLAHIILRGLFHSHPSK